MLSDNCVLLLSQLHSTLDSGRLTRKLLNELLGVDFLLLSVSSLAMDNMCGYP